MRAPDPSIIMGTIQSPVCLDGFADRFNGGGLGDVHLDEGGFPAVFRDHMDGLLSTVFVHVRNDQFRPLPEQTSGLWLAQSLKPLRD